MYCSTAAVHTLTIHTRPELQAQHPHAISGEYFRFGSIFSVLLLLLFSAPVDVDVVLTVGVGGGVLEAFVDGGGGDGPFRRFLTSNTGQATETMRGNQKVLRNSRQGGAGHAGSTHP